MDLFLHRQLALQTSDVPDREKETPTLGREAQGMRASWDSFLGPFPMQNDFMKAHETLWLHCSETQRTNAPGTRRKESKGMWELHTGGQEAGVGGGGLYNDLRCLGFFIPSSIT